MQSKKAVLSLSGGMDSSTLLLHLLAKGYEVTALSFDYGQKHKMELDRADSLVQYVNSQIKGQSVPLVRHRRIVLGGLSELLNSTLVEGGRDVPEGHYEQSNMKETVVPNRNKIFSSIIQAVALSIATSGEERCEVDIALGIHAGDHCFSKNTKILTPNGLKTINELKEQDVIFSFNTETNKWELDTVTHIVKKNKVDYLFKIRTLAGDLELTSEHKVYRLKVTGFHPVYGYRKEIELVPVSELREGDYLVQPTNLPTVNTTNLDTIDLLPVLSEILPKYDKGLTLQEEDGYLWLGGHADLYKSKKIKRHVNAESLVAIFAWYIAEGWSSKDPYVSKNRASRYYASFSQSLKANLDKVDLIKQMIDQGELPIRYQFAKTLHNGIPKEVVFNVNNILSALLKEAGAHSRIKHIPQWLFNILTRDVNLREIFLYHLGLGDGFNTEKSIRGFCSTSSQLLEQVTTLVQLSGYFFKFTHNPKIETRTLTYGVQERKTAYLSLGDAKFVKIRDITEVEYGDHVYDITVRNNHNFCAGSYGSLLISNSIYPDCRQEFRDIDFQAFKAGNWDSEYVKFYTPYLLVNKYDILQDGADCCTILNLDFNEVYKRTNTSYKPIWIPYGLYEHTDTKVSREVFAGEWYSDYKSASSVERIEAFLKLGRPDPVKYADETGPVTWEVAKDHVLKVLEEHNSKN